MVIRFGLDALSTFSSQLESLSEENPTAKSYCESWVPLDVLAGGALDYLFNKVCSTAESVSSNIGDRLGILATLLSDAGTEVANCATAYSTTDIAVIESIESVYGVRYVDPDVPSSRYSTGTPAGDPSGELKEPSSGSAIPDFLATALGILGFGGNVSGAVTTAVSIFPPVADMLTKLEKFFSGDWNKVARTSRALSCLSDYSENMSDCINDDRLAVMETWEGEAAESANNWLLSLVTETDNFSRAIDAAAEQFEQVSTGMQITAAAIGSLLGLLAGLLAAMVAEAIAAFFTLGATAAAEPETAAAAGITVGEILTAISVGIATAETLLGAAQDACALSGLDGIQNPSGDSPLLSSPLTSLTDFDAPAQYAPPRAPHPGPHSHHG